MKVKKKIILIIIVVNIIIIVFLYFQLLLLKKYLAESLKVGIREEGFIEKGRPKVITALGGKIQLHVLTTL